MVRARHRGRRGRTHAPGGDEPPAPSPLDVTGGLRRTAGNRKLYLTLLRRFREGHGDAPSRIGEALARGDVAGARFLLHTVKGVSGNIGASGVQAAAAQLERALADEVLPSRLDDFLRPLAEAFEAAARQIESHLSDAPEPAEPAQRQEVDTAALAPRLSRLAGLLAEDDGEAVDCLASLRDSLAAALAPDDLEKLESAVGAFDFERALARLRELAAGLGIEL